MSKKIRFVLSGLKNAKKSRLLFCTLFFTVLIELSTFSPVVIPLLKTYADQRSTQYQINIRADAGTQNDIVGVIEPGSLFNATDTKEDDEGNLWAHISYNGIDGYVLARYAVDPSEVETEPETKEEEERSTQEADNAESTNVGNGSQQQGSASQPSWSGHVQSESEFEAQLSAFPASYQPLLRAVHEAHPNYTFSADYINMDFEELVDAEVGKKVSSYYASSWKAMYDESFGYYENYDWDTGEWMNSEGTFTYASREIIRHFIDPRNFINTNDIYMFMRQSYSSEQTVDDLRSIIAGSFLSQGYLPDEEENDQRLGGDYAAVLMEAARASGSSPYVLAASILLEHGYYGQTPLISGYYEAEDETVYEGYYNFFDIGATGSDSNNVIQNGLEYAKNQGWTSRYLSIVDGAIWITDSYINNGQDTYYYKEYNVINGWDSLWHQYSTGVMTAYSSSAFLRETLSGNYYAALDFRIPVYTNMPEEPAEEPAYNDNLNNYYFTDMQATGLEPEFSMANRNYTMTVTSDTSLDIAVPMWATYEGQASYQLAPGTNIISLDVRSQTGYLRTYHIEVSSAGNFVLTVNTFEGNRLNISGNGTTDSIWGDANGDGKVTSLDYIAIKKHIMEEDIITDEILLKAADVNEDGVITSLDYIAIKNYIMAQ